MTDFDASGNGNRYGVALMALWLCSAVPAWAQADEAWPWQRMANMPIGVFNARAAVSGKYALIIGGVGQTGAPINLAQVYDLELDRWLKPMTLHTGRNKHAQVTLGDGRVLIAGGNILTSSGQWRALASCELIDVERRQVSKAPDLPDLLPPPTAHLLAGGHAIVIGGDIAMVFDPAQDLWVGQIELQRHRNSHASVVLPTGKIMVMGGDKEASIEVIDPASGTSELLALQLPIAMDDMHACLTADGRVWVLGGQNGVNGNTTDRTWLITVGDDGVSQLTEGPDLKFDAGISDACVASIGDSLVLLGGESQRSYQDSELKLARLLNRRSLAVTVLPDLHSPHDDAVAVVYRSHVIVFGGLAMRRIGQLQVPVAVRTVEKLRLKESD